MRPAMPSTRIQCDRRHPASRDASAAFDSTRSTFHRLTAALRPAPTGPCSCTPISVLFGQQPLATSANARNKIFFSCAPEDAHQLARHTLPELDEHDLSHTDAFRAACRLVVDGRETAAFTPHTNPPKPLVGEATAVRQPR